MSTISSDKAEIVAAAWQALERERPDFALEILAAVNRLEEGAVPHTAVVKLAWMTGFNHCLVALEIGAIQPLGPPGTKPQNN